MGVNYPYPVQYYRSNGIPRAIVDRRNFPSLFVGSLAQAIWSVVFPLSTFPIGIHCLYCFSTYVMFMTLTISFHVFRANRVSRSIVNMANGVPFSICAFYRPIRNVVPVPNSVSLYVFRHYSISPYVVEGHSPTFIYLRSRLQPPKHYVNGLRFVSGNVFNFWGSSLYVMFPTRFFSSVCPSPN